MKAVIAAGRSALARSAFRYGGLQLRYTEDWWQRVASSSWPAGSATDGNGVRQLVSARV
jgi:hypothetical protein